MSIEGSADAESFSLYLKEVLCPALGPGQIVVMGNLYVHKGKHVRECIEERGWSCGSYLPTHRTSTP